MQSRVYALSGNKKRVLRLFVGIDLILLAAVISEAGLLSCMPRQSYTSDRLPILLLQGSNMAISSV